MFIPYDDSDHTTCDRWGHHLYLINLADETWLRISANKFEVKDGSLLLYGQFLDKEYEPYPDKKERLLLSFAPKTWTSIFAISVITGAVVNVQFYSKE